MHHRLRFALGAFLLFAAPGLLAAQQGTPTPPKVKQVPPGENVTLPRPDFHYEGNVGRTLAESDPPAFPLPIRAPAGAPNVVLILIDDTGFGTWGTFGGQTPTPGLDRVARDGLRYNTFHTTALCSPTRAALLTGRNHHSVGTGVITEAATGYDGYTGIIPKSAGTVAEVLRQNGYATAWFGKNHNTPDWETSLNGPFDRWPSGLGFDYFYGFMGGDADQWRPTLYENHTLVPASTDPDYLLTPDLTNKAIAWLRRVRSIDPSKPYFMYMAPGATHAPHHASPEWIAKFKGQFDQGWDVYRQQTFERQKRLGVVPANAELTPRPAELPAWESLSADQKRMFARMMEVFAAFTAQTDYEMHRLLDVVRAQPDADNTIIIYAIGDNGASAEGGLVGLFNEGSFFNAVPETLSVNMAKIDELGGPKHFNHFPAGWAWAMDTPFQWTKQVASHFGGTRNPLVISWPKRIREKGGLRQQFHHVIDIVPTIYEAAGITPPSGLNGIVQQPIEGVSMAYSFDSAAAPSHRRTQYFELLGNRAIYSDGWVAASRASIPWASIRTPPDLDTLRWELYHVAEDFSQARDLAQQEPEKVRAMESLWWGEAGKYHVLPLDTRAAERLSAEMQGRPTPTAGRTTFTYYPGTVAVPSGSAPNLLNKSWTVTADVVVPRGNVNGALWAMGGGDGGFALYVRNGKPVAALNFLGRVVHRAAGTANLPAGPAKLRAQFTYDGGGIGKSGTLALFVNDRKVGEVRVPQTQAITLGLGGTLDVGTDTGASVDEVYPANFSFNGTINTVTVELKPER